MLITVFSNQLTHILWEEADFGELFWFCDFVSYILAFALFTKNRFLISTVLLASVPAQFLWIADFFMNLAGSGLGRTDWLFTDNDVWWTPWISTLMHGMIIPLSAWGVWKYGFDKRAIWGVYAIILFLLPATYFFTDPTINRNCVFFPCDLNFIDDKAYISAHTDYFMTWKYLLKEMLSWVFYSSSVYLVFRFFTDKYFKKAQALFKSSTNK